MKTFIVKEKQMGIRWANKKVVLVPEKRCNLCNLFLLCKEVEQ